VNQGMHAGIVEEGMGLKTSTEIITHRITNIKDQNSEFAQLPGYGRRHIQALRKELGSELISCRKPIYPQPCISGLRKIRLGLAVPL
jgi:hypothetical protein